MSLAIETFSNAAGGNAVYKALSHPLAAEGAAALIGRLSARGPVAVYDPHGLAEGFAALYDLSPVEVAAVYVQRLDDIGRTVLGRRAQPVTDLSASGARSVLVAAFDAARPTDHIRHLLPPGATVESLDALRLPEEMLTRRARYLDPLNFATNFAFFRDTSDRHTRLVTANYWAGHGAEATALHLILFGADGTRLAAWREALPPRGSAIVLDSAEIRRRFGLAPFTGQLFVHAAGVAGHDTVKYALDVFGEDGELSCTHDANAWPAERYAGLPAPAEGETVLLWVQNSHPCAIPAGAVSLHVMGEERGEERGAALAEPVPPFATLAVDTRSLLPEAAWPQQIEVRAGKHFVRPRYEVRGRGRRWRIAHVNVERTDLAPDPAIPDLGNLMGKGYILPAPLLPPERWRSVVLPTPMSTAQETLPLALLVQDGSGREIARHRFGVLPRGHRAALDASALAEAAGGLPSGYGHLELVYDFDDGGEADGWMHALFRYEDRAGGHAAETSFGAHIFNTVLTWRGEPQSYIADPPGLSTRLFLRLGAPPRDTLCHLIYPASTPWHAASSTALILYDGEGQEVARRRVEIPCGGSYLWRYREAFDADERARAGGRGYIVVRDRTCRLFGYHGLIDDAGAFSLDHMFGF